MLTKDKVLNALSKVNDPELHRSLTDLKMVRDVTVCNGKVEVTVALTVPDCQFAELLNAFLKKVPVSMKASEK
jgi:ATP-binding protein involved in chromosome partitioning